MNEKIVLDFYLGRLDANEVSFLAGKEEHKKNVRNHIVSLRDSQTMHDKIQIAKDLWKSLFESSMTHIDPDKRGYDELFKFFDEYVEFEELIFASDAFYRDHTVHCLWVYFLGEYLYHNEEYKFIVKNMFSQLEKTVVLCDDMKKAKDPDLFSNTMHLANEFTSIINYADSIRCLAALTHDLGYPLKKIRKINSSISRILPYFSIENYNEFDFNFNNTQVLFVKDFIEHISMDFRTDIVGDDDTNGLLKRIVKVDDERKLVGLNIEVINNLSEQEIKAVKKLFTINLLMQKDVGKFLRYSNDFENHEHGILSAYLLMKTLGFFRDVKFKYSYNDSINTQDINIHRVFSGIYILSAICDHTSKGYQIEAIDDTSSLLTFVDELEEFSRISRANQNREFINEFCKTDIYVEDGYFNVDFTFDNVNIDTLNPELAFKGRCKKMLQLFKVSSLDEEFRLKLRCIGKLPKNSNEYCIEIRRKFANITINGEEVHIPTYLKSKEFYSKEEYASM